MFGRRGAEPGRFGLEFRVLDRGDVAHLESMLSVFGRAFDDPDSYDRFRPGADYLAGLLDNPHVVALAAVHDGGVVGGLVAYVLPKFEQARSEIYIYDLAVDEPFRRRGIATGLINKLRAVAVERGAWSIYVQADRDDAPAVALYSKLGLCTEVFHFDLTPRREVMNDAEPGARPDRG